MNRDKVIREFLYSINIRPSRPTEMSEGIIHARSVFLEILRQGKSAFNNNSKFKIFTQKILEIEIIDREVTLMALMIMISNWLEYGELDSDLLHTILSYIGLPTMSNNLFLAYMTARVRFPEGLEESPSEFRSRFTAALLDSDMRSSFLKFMITYCPIGDKHTIESYNKTIYYLEEQPTSSI